MDTLLERLRVQQEWFSDGHGALHKEAADEIERLQEEVHKAFDMGYRAAGGTITPIIGLQKVTCE